MKTDIGIYILTSENLKLRFNHLNQQIVRLKGLFDKADYNYQFYQINNPSSSDIEKNLDKYKDRVILNKDEITDNDFKNLVAPINTSQLSNFMKQLKALEMIKNGKNKINFIIEDDIMIIDDFANNFLILLEKLKTQEFDLIFTSVAINDNSPDFKFLKSLEYFKVLISKSSYFVTNDCASKLLSYFEKIRFNYKMNLSYYIWENKDTINSLIFNKNLLFEGSKIGLFSTSINNNNFLYQNGEYVKLAQLIGNHEYLDDEVVKKAEEIYNSSGKNNPDFQHSLGLVYYKNKNYKKAKETLIDAILNLKKTDGLISQHNEALNNCINMHQFEQSDIENVLKLPGIYS
jgi:GR25 family glycosyltransferase involved in LPS biosynthesis